MDERLELLLREDGEVTQLLAPLAGMFTCAIPRGTPLGPGQDAGKVLRLGRTTTLIVPAGVSGLVTSPRPERVHAPVSYADVLYELSPLAGLAGDAGLDSGAPASDSDGRLVLRAPQSGRFYHRPSPDEDVLAPPGTTLSEGTPVGLVEVMKTFAHVPYRAEGGLPNRARVVRHLTTDGADVSAGDPLLEVEPL